LTLGTLSLGSSTLSCSIFQSNNTNTRTLAFGTGKITITGNATTVINVGTITGLTTTGNKQFDCTYSGATGTRGVSSSNSLIETNAFAVNITAGTDIVSISGAVKDINLTGFAGTFSNATRTLYGNLTVSTGATISAGTGVTTLAATSGTQQITTNGKTLDFPLTFNGIGGTFAFQDALTQGSTRAFTITKGTVQLKAGATSTVGSFATSGTNQKYLQSTSNGVQATLSQASGTVNASYLTIKDINATGGATWNAYVTNNNINAGNNTGWDFYLPVNSIYDSLRLRGYTGTVTDMLLQYYKTNGATSNSLQDAESEFLILKGFTSGSNTDKWYAYLRSLSFTGTVTDMLFNYWKDPA